MPDSILDDANHWRARAEQARALAEQMAKPEAKQTILRIAQDYDRLAELAERKDKAT